MAKSKNSNLQQQVDDNTKALLDVPAENIEVNPCKAIAEEMAASEVVPVGVRRTRPESKLPTYATDGAAGLDLYADLDPTSIVVIHPGERVKIGTGISVSIPRGYEGQIRPRSGMATRDGVVCSLGTIDSDYRGEMVVNLINHGHSLYTVQPGARIAQLVISPVPRVKLVEVDELDNTERGSNGFGSTGA